MRNLHSIGEPPTAYADFWDRPLHVPHAFSEAVSGGAETSLQRYQRGLWRVYERPAWSPALGREGATILGDLMVRRERLVRAFPRVEGYSLTLSHGEWVALCAELPVHLMQSYFGREGTVPLFCGIPLLIT